MKTALTVKLTAGELLDWARNLQWFYPRTMKLSTFIDTRTRPSEIVAIRRAEDRPLPVRAFNGRGARR